MIYRSILLCLAVVSTGLPYMAARDAWGEVIITEIMYNPDGVDRDDAAGIHREWVEVFNTSSTTVDLGGWQLADLQDQEFATLVPAGTLLGPQQALVLVGDAATFDAQWGTGIHRVELGRFPILANDPSLTNETLAFYDSVNSIGDAVNYDDQGAWPPGSPDGASIQLRPESLSTSKNNQGGSWLPSMWGVYGTEFRRSPAGTEDRGSPGFVETTSQAPFTPSPDAAWSMVVIPDTQNYVKSTSDFPRLLEVMDWIVEHKHDWNIQVVLQEGDIVNQNSQVIPTSGNQSGDQQWQNAKQAFSRLDGVVPYIFSPGNHDYGTTNAQNRLSHFNDYFKASDNPLVDPAQGGILAGRFVPDKLDSAYYEFTAPDGREMLLVTLEWGPRQFVVDAANELMAGPAIADHTAVLMTHAYMYHDETRYDWRRNLDADPNNNQGGNPYSYATAGDTNDGEDLWQELVSQHDQFEMVLSGHVGGDGVAYLGEAGSGGQLVHQMLFNTQFEANGGNGWFRLIEFLDDGTTVRVRTYSPFYNLAKTDAANDFTFQITPLPTALAGDFNADGVVDLADYAVWRDKLGAAAGTLPNDVDGGVIGSAQYDTWKQNFGATLPSSSSLANATVPEPSTGVLVVLFALAITCRSLQRHADAGAMLHSIKLLRRGHRRQLSEHRIC